MWAGGRDIFDNRFHTAGKRGGRAGQQAGIGAGPGKYMGQRQEEKDFVTFHDRRTALYRLGGKGDIVVGKHRPFGYAGGSRGVHDAGGVLRGYRVDSLLVVLVGNIPAQGEEILEVENPVIPAGIAVEKNDFAYIGNTVLDLVELGQLRIVFRENHDGVGMVNDILAILGQIGLIDPHRDGPDAGDPHVAQHPPVAAVAEDVDLVALFNAQGHEAFGHAFDLVVEHAPTDSLPDTGFYEPPVGWFVKVTIHRLFEHVIDVAVICKLHASPFPQYEALLARCYS